MVVVKRGIPAAKLVSFEQSQKRQLGFVEGSLPNTFFDPLDEEEIGLWEGLSQAFLKM